MKEGEAHRRLWDVAGLQKLEFLLFKQCFPISPISTLNKPIYPGGVLINCLVQKASYHN